MADQDSLPLHKEFELLKGAEQRKNNLIEILLARLDDLKNDYQQSKLDHAREQHYNRDGQLREQAMQEETRRLKASMERDPYVLVLLDGDGMIFDEQFLQAGEEGGREAANCLYTAIGDYIYHLIPDFPSDFRIMTRLYANLKGLGEVCFRSGLLEKPFMIADFARGFTGSKSLFDFVDVGTGKDRADEKISEIFKLHLYDPHCRHILLGGSHDNGYARLLENVADETNVNRVTLLEGPPFERELIALSQKYYATKFEGLFRTTKINIYDKQSPVHTQPPHLQNHQSAPPDKLPPTPANYQSPYQPGIARPVLAPSSSSNLNGAAPSWASTVLTAASQAVSPPPTPQPMPKSVPRNRYGQRVDDLTRPDPMEIKRIQKLKLCTTHFLRNECDFGDSCVHMHQYKPTKNDIATLTYICRLRRCHYGTECDDVKCTYGHRCPTGAASMRECRFGDECRFPDEMHGIDTNVVQMTKVGGK